MIQTCLIHSLLTWSVFSFIIHHVTRATKTVSGANTELIITAVKVKFRGLPGLKSRYGSAVFPLEVWQRAHSLAFPAFKGLLCSLSYRFLPPYSKQSNAWLSLSHANSGFLYYCLPFLLLKTSVITLSLQR